MKRASFPAIFVLAALGCSGTVATIPREALAPTPPPPPMPRVPPYPGPLDREQAPNPNAAHFAAAKRRRRNVARLSGART